MKPKCRKPVVKASTKAAVCKYFTCGTCGIVDGKLVPATLPVTCDRKAVCLGYCKRHARAEYLATKRAYDRALKELLRWKDALHKAEVALP